VNDVATGNGGIGGIGFCSSWHMAALEKKGAGQSVKVLAIKKDSNTQAVKPILGTHEERDYPIERPLHIYYDSNKGKLTQAFVEFCVKTIKFANVNSSRS
jgi:ABC-type phosphate transport system substrate-binding protein